MFQTGSRTIFDVCKDHIGHSIEMLDIQEEGVIKGIKVYCRTCSMTLLQQETYDYSITSEISRRKAIRLQAMTYERWEYQFMKWFRNEHDKMCDCGQWDDCVSGEVPMYESSELQELYESYLDTLIERPTTTGWDTREPQPRTSRVPSAGLWDVDVNDTWES